MSIGDDTSSEDFAALLEESEQRSQTGAGRVVAVGDVVSGIVASISKEAVFVDLGGKSEGVLELDQVTDTEGELSVVVGDTIEAWVVDAGEHSGVVELKCKLGKGADAQRELELAYTQAIPVEGVVMAVNKGGFDVQVAGVHAFCPSSQMDSRFVENLEAFIGKRHCFRITRYEASGRGDPNIVLSRRVLLDQEAAEQAIEIRAQLKVGSVFSGKVSSIENYGVFVDLGGVEGMLHISELGYSRVEHPSDVVEMGQELEVQVIKVESTDNPRRPEKIGLSLKSMLRDPWDEVTSNLSVGQRVTGGVVRIEQFGAFVEIAPGVEGLVHISEMGAGERISSPRKVVSLGQKVEASVLAIDAEQRRISLSIDAAARAAQSDDEREAMTTYGSSKQSLGTMADLLKGIEGKK